MIRPKHSLTMPVNSTNFKETCRMLDLLGYKNVSSIEHTNPSLIVTYLNGTYVLLGGAPVNAKFFGDKEDDCKIDLCMYKLDALFQYASIMQENSADTLFTVRGNKHLLGALANELQENYDFVIFWDKKDPYLSNSVKNDRAMVIYGTDIESFLNYTLLQDYEKAKEAFIKGLKPRLAIDKYLIKVESGGAFIRIESSRYSKEFIHSLINHMEHHGQIHSLNVGCTGQFKVDIKKLKEIYNVMDKESVL